MNSLLSEFWGRMDGWMENGPAIPEGCERVEKENEGVTQKRGIMPVPRLP
jgi:hypothetical protein